MDNDYFLGYCDAVADVKEAAFPSLGKVMTPLWYLSDIKRWLKMGKPMFQPHKAIPKKIPMSGKGFWRS
jgi:hypothetical protein